MYDQDLLSIDEQMEHIFSILTEKEAVYQRMAQFRKSWSLEKFIQDQNPTNPNSSQAQDTKISADEVNVTSSSVPISALESELTKGYTIMPKDRAEYDFRRGVYKPTIKIENLDEFIAFDFEFPPETREHGFMISFKGETQYWNKPKKTFQTEIIKIKI